MKTISHKAYQAFQQWGKKGGEIRAQNLSFLKRREIAKHAARMRWKKRKFRVSFMPSVRLETASWHDPVYLEEVLSDGTLSDWRELRRRIANHPFGAEAEALEKVLTKTHIYGVTSLWRRILYYLQGKSL